MKKMITLIIVIKKTHFIQLNRIRNSIGQKSENELPTFYHFVGKSLEYLLSIRK